MQEMEQNKKNDFVIEKIKERPINKKKLIKRTITTAFMAVMFGLIACFTFLVLEPVISDWLYPQEEPEIVLFPEEQEEMEPEEMLSDNLPTEATPTPSSSALFSGALEQEQMQEILTAITLDENHYAQLYSSLADLFKEISRSTVIVTAIKSNADWLANVTESQTNVMGVVIGNNGKELLILTNYSPLKNADSLRLTFSGDYTIEGKLKQWHTASDIAILSVNVSDLGSKIENIQTASFGSSSTQNLLFTPVLAIGSPQGECGSVGFGMITSESGQITMVDANYKLLLTDIYGSKSASGFLVNMKGQIIGMITTKKTTSDMPNVIAAYGISDLKKLISNLSEGSAIAYLGITGTDVSVEANIEAQVPIGVYVKNVAMDSPAMKAGIQPGDIITSIGNTIVTNYSNYYNAITYLESGSTVKLKIKRQFQNEYREMEFDILLGEAN